MELGRHFETFAADDNRSWLIRKIELWKILEEPQDNFEEAGKAE